MTREERERREERALDALAASFFHISSEDEPDAPDDPEILDEADRRALEGLGDDLVDRLLAGERPGARLPPAGGFTEWTAPGTAGMPPEIVALHRGDELLTPEVLEELERHRRELLADEGADFEDFEE